MEGLEDLATYVFASIVVVVAIVGINEWLRDHRLRAAYKETRRNGNANPKMGQRMAATHTRSMSVPPHPRTDYYAK